MLKEKNKRINQNRKKGWVATALGFLTMFFFLSCLAKSAAASGILTNGIGEFYSQPVLSFFWDISIVMQIGTLRMAFLACICAAPLILGGYLLSQAKKEKEEIKGVRQSIEEERLREELKG